MLRRIGNVLAYIILVLILCGSIYGVSKTISTALYVFNILNSGKELYAGTGRLESFNTKEMDVYDLYDNENRLIMADMLEIKDIEIGSTIHYVYTKDGSLYITNTYLDRVLLYPAISAILGILSVILLYVSIRHTNITVDEEDFVDIGDTGIDEFGMNVDNVIPMH